MAATDIGTHGLHMKLARRADATSCTERGQRPNTPEQFDGPCDVQLERLVPRAYRGFLTGKDFCADGCFYLHDGNAWSFFKAGFVDD